MVVVNEGRRTKKEIEEDQGGASEHYEKIKGLNAKKLLEQRLKEKELASANGDNRDGEGRKTWADEVAEIKNRKCRR